MQLDVRTLTQRDSEILLIRAGADGGVLIGERDFSVAECERRLGGFAEEGVAFLRLGECGDMAQILERVAPRQFVLARGAQRSDATRARDRDVFGSADAL